MSGKTRNLILRTATGIAFVAVVAGGISLGYVTFTLLFAIVTGLSVREFCHLVNCRADVRTNTVICTMAGVYLFLAVSGFCSNIAPSGIFIPYLLSVAYLLVSELYLKSPHALNNWAYAMMSQMYVALPFASLNALAYRPEASYSIGAAYSGILPLSVFVFLWVGDTGAYCIGSLLGRHKLFPRVSPNKSWEGFAGGVLAATAASQVFAAFEPLPGRWAWLGLALTVAVSGVWGDLVESLLKRQLHIKDSGKALPGHGGMLDRFDSSLLAIPASVVYLYTLTLL